MVMRFARTRSPRDEQEGITSSTAKKFRVTTTDSKHSLPVAENILDRDFTAERPGQKVVSDLTYIATAEGFLYLVCMIDVCTRRVIGWSMSHEMTTDVFLSALEMAVWKYDHRRASAPFRSWQSVLQ